MRAISDPYPGSWHDAHAYAETEWADYIGDDGGIGDKGYVGTGLVTPRKKRLFAVLSGLLSVRTCRRAWGW